MSKYVCRRATPWESMPRRSAEASTSAARSASARGTPKCSNTRALNSCRRSLA
jgi:hypothetical protein